MLNGVAHVTAPSSVAAAVATPSVTATCTACAHTVARPPKPGRNFASCCRPPPSLPRFNDAACLVRRSSFANTSFCATAPLPGFLPPRDSYIAHASWNNASLTHASFRRTATHWSSYLPSADAQRIFASIAVVPPAARRTSSSSCTAQRPDSSGSLPFMHCASITRRAAARDFARRNAARSLRTRFLATATCSLSLVQSTTNSPCTGGGNLL